MNHFSVHLKLTQHCKSTILQLKNNLAFFFFNKRNQGLGRPSVWPSEAYLTGPGPIRKNVTFELSIVDLKSLPLSKNQKKSHQQSDGDSPIDISSLWAKKSSPKWPSQRLHPQSQAEKSSSCSGRTPCSWRRENTARLGESLVLPRPLRDQGSWPPSQVGLAQTQKESPAQRPCVHLPLGCSI